MSEWLGSSEAIRRSSSRTREIRPSSSHHRTPAHLPLTAADRPMARRRPMLPKQTQLQNSTLSIHTPVSTVSCRASPPRVSKSSWEVALVTDALPNETAEGVGIISGLTPRRKAEPVRPTAAARTKPGLERSISHQRRGFTRASDRDTWRVDAQATFR